MSEKIYKASKSGPQRLGRLVAAALDPRAYLHAFKLINFANYTHVAELRKVQRGDGVRISPTASFANGQNIVLGDRVRIGAHCSIWAGNGSARIVFGEDVLLAPNVMITAANYRFNDGAPVTEQAMNEADVIIGRDVWIGYGATVLPGARIGDGAIIGAGARVRGEVPRGAILADPPTPIVGYRRMAAAEDAPSDADADAGAGAGTDAEGPSAGA